MSEEITKVRDLAVALAASLAQLAPEDRERVLFIANGGKYVDHHPLKADAPYYDEKYAMILKKTLDKFADTPRNTTVTFKCAEYRLRRKSIQNRIFSAWKYLIDFLDTPDRKYANLRQQVMVREHPEGVQLVWKKGADLLYAPKLEPEFSTVELDERPWKKQIDQFLDEAEENDKLDLRVHLKPEDITWLEDYLLGSLDSIVYNISLRRVTLIKNKDLAKAVKDLGLKLSNTDMAKIGEKKDDSRETSGDEQ